MNTAKWTILLLCCCLSILEKRSIATSENDTLKPLTLKHVETIREGLSPKSVVYSGDGLFFAQNMMYRHTVTVYNRDFELVKTIRDKVNLKAYGFEQYGENDYRGAPVEAAFSHNGRYAWITNYQMYGDSTNSPGCDGCKISQNYDKSFVYKINTRSYAIESIIEVGCVPKYIATTPNNKYVLISNWSSGDLSIVDIAQNKEVDRIALGRYPRGIVVDSRSEYAYVAIMGSNKIARIRMSDRSVTWFNDIGYTPRHLCLDSRNQYLYVSLNNSGRIAKIDVSTGKIIDKVKSGSHPRSMVLSSNDQFIYAVNYFSDSVSKIDARTMTVVEKVKTKSKPIGITFDDRTNQVWVACYSGSLMVFQETEYAPIRPVLPEQLVELSPNFSVYPNRLQCFSPEQYTNFVGVSPASNEIALEPESSLMDGLAAEPVPDAVTAEEEEPETVVESPRQPVVEEQPTAKQVPETTKTINVERGNYHVIGGSFKSEANAKKLLATLKEQGYTPEYFRRDDGFYLVSYGGYGSRELAKVAMQKIRAESGVGAWVFKR